MQILITGATGFVGREVLRQLHAGGHRLRLLARNARSAGNRLPIPVNEIEFHEGNVTDARSLTGIAQDCEAVIHLVGIISEVGKTTFDNLHVNATRNIIAAAQGAGVRRYLHMSALGTRPHAVARYHQTKWEAEEAVRQSGLNFTIFRPSIIYGPEDHFVNLFARMSRWTPVLPVMGDGRNLFQPVAVENVARCFVGALSEPGSVGRAFDVCGPERLNFNDILDAILRVTNRRRLKFHVPMPLARLQAAMLETLLPLLFRQAPPLNRDQLLMLREDNVGDERPATELFRLESTRFEDGIRRYLKHGA